MLSSGPAKGETMGGCMWTADNQGMVTISTIRAAQGAQREAGLAGIGAAFATLRTRGWTEETKAFPDARCSLMTPPPGQRTAAVMTGCMAEVGGMAIACLECRQQFLPPDLLRRDGVLWIDVVQGGRRGYWTGHADGRTLYERE